MLFCSFLATESSGYQNYDETVVVPFHLAVKLPICLWTALYLPSLDRLYAVRSVAPQQTYAQS